MLCLKKCGIKKETFNTIISNNKREVRRGDTCTQTEYKISRTLLVGENFSIINDVQYMFAYCF